MRAAGAGGRVPASSRFRGLVLLARGSSRRSFMFWSKSWGPGAPGGTFWKWRLASGMRGTSCVLGGRVGQPGGGRPADGGDSGTSPRGQQMGRVDPRPVCSGSLDAPTPTEAGPRP